jgi:hypothetical protein
MKKVVKQLVLFVPTSRVLDVAQEPYRVWTLMSETNEDATVVPSLPIEPAHLKNAFLEDKLHDWSWRAGKLRYYSRVALHNVWILVEFAK